MMVVPRFMARAPGVWAGLAASPADVCGYEAGGVDVLTPARRRAQAAARLARAGPRCLALGAPERRGRAPRRAGALFRGRALRPGARLHAVDQLTGVGAHDAPKAERARPHQARHDQRIEHGGQARQRHALQHPAALRQHAAVQPLPRAPCAPVSLGMLSELDRPLAVPPSQRARQAPAARTSPFMLHITAAAPLGCGTLQPGHTPNPFAGLHVRRA